jgi:hypothetical protein
MDFNKRREHAFERLLANKPEIECPSSIFFECSNQPRDTCMSDLGLQPREVFKQPDQLPAEERLGKLRKHKQASESAVFSFFFHALPIPHIPLVWHSVFSNLT